MTPLYYSPGRRQTSREATIREAMTIPGRFKPDGCRREMLSADGTKVLRVYQLNRKFRRSGGRAS